MNTTPYDQLAAALGVAENRATAEELEKVAKGKAALEGLRKAAETPALWKVSRLDEKSEPLVEIVYEKPESTERCVNITPFYEDPPALVANTLTLRN